MKSDAFSHRSGAFTLVEMLVAMTILAFIVTILALTASQASRIWRAAEAGNQRRATGRALLQFMARDLEMARVRAPYPGEEGANLQFVISDPGRIGAGLLNPHAGFWQAPVAMDRSRGEMAEVGYFVRWDTTSEPGTARARLCRLLVDPAETALYRIYSSDADGVPAQWPDETILDTIASADATDEYRGWFADDVIALWLRCLDRNGAPIVRTAAGDAIGGGWGFDSRKGYTLGGTGGTRAAPALPASVEIVLVSVDARTARRITAPVVAAPGSPADFWKDETTPGSLAHFLAGLPEAIKPGVQVFTTRVDLRNAPL